MPAPDIIQQLVQRFEDNLSTYRSGHYDETQLQRQIDLTDHEIDRLVYDLYELTAEEIKIVEADKP
jgi:hypothetical protein